LTIFCIFNQICTNFQCIKKLEKEENDEIPQLINLIMLIEFFYGVVIFIISIYRNAFSINRSLESDIYLSEFEAILLGLNCSSQKGIHADVSRE